jgi:hypothetical protein
MALNHFARAALSSRDEEIRRMREALADCANLIDNYYFEGDKEYQVVIIARAALSHTSAAGWDGGEAKEVASGSEYRGIGIGMAVAAGIIMQAWGDETKAREILGAAALDTLEKLQALGVEQYDIDALMPILATEGSTDEN